MHNDPRLSRGEGLPWIVFLVGLIALGFALAHCHGQTAPKLVINAGQFTNLGVNIYAESSTTNPLAVKFTALTKRYVEIKVPTGVNTNWVYRLQFRDNVNLAPWQDSPMTLKGNGKTQSFFAPSLSNRFYRVIVN